MECYQTSNWHPLIGQTRVTGPRSTQTLWAMVAGLVLTLALALAPGNVNGAESSVTNTPPLISVRQFLEGAPGWGESKRVRLQGTVTHSISDRTFFIQQGEDGTYVFHKPTPPFAVGDEVEVTGFPSLGGFAPTLQHCETRKLGPGRLPLSRTISFQEARAGKGHMLLVRIQGRLASQRLRGGQTLVLTSAQDTNVFTVELEAIENVETLTTLAPGSLLEVTGVCSVRRDSNKRPTTFAVFTRTADDIKVLQPPPWWTLERAGRVLGLAALGLAVVLLWVLSLRAQVRRQTAEIRRMNDALEARVARRTAQLSAANKELEAFSYSVSHDLRAPVRHIDSFASLLLQRPELAGDPAIRKSLEQITGSALRIGRLIDALLSFARMSRAPIASGNVALDPLVEEVRRELEPDIAGRQINWQIARLPEVRGDAAMLQLVWQNLLSNAIKYTRRQSAAMIAIGAQAGDDAWTFSVRDNGVGFDMRHASQLFGVFHRLHGEEEFEGTGIGLANVRRIIERHGGRVWAEATPNVGATFHFTLPRRPVEPTSTTGL